MVQTRTSPFLQVIVNTTYQPTSIALYTGSYNVVPQPVSRTVVFQKLNWNQVWWR